MKLTHVGLILELTFKSIWKAIDSSFSMDSVGVILVYYIC